MIILYSSLQNEPMVELGTIQKSFAFYMSDIMINGLENVLKSKFTEEEVNENFQQWSEDLKQEMHLREVQYEYYEKIYYDIHGVNIVLNKLTYQKNAINLKQLQDYQNKILNNDVIDIEKDLLSNIDLDDIKLSFDNKAINHEKQKHKTSCTLASLAMITHQPYDKVFKELTTRHQLKRVFSTNETQWKEYLNEYGYNLGEMKKVCNWNDVPDYALCVVYGSNYYQKVTREILHAVVFRREHGFIWILDPGLDKIKYDFWNYNLGLTECYEITKKP